MWPPLFYAVRVSFGAALVLSIVLVFATIAFAGSVSVSRCVEACLPLGVCLMAMIQHPRHASVGLFVAVMAMRTTSASCGDSFSNPFLTT